MALLTSQNRHVRSATVSSESGIVSLPSKRSKPPESPGTTITFLPPIVARVQSASSQLNFLSFHPYKPGETEELDPGHCAMPYNNAAIPPTEEITGSASLPLARVKRILHIDEEISQCSANAAFAITVATEMFIRYLSEQALNVVKSERKPRRNIQYKDLANAVSRIDNLEFLSDVIPRTTTFKEFKAKKARAALPSEPLQNGQTTLNIRRHVPQQPIEAHEELDGAGDDITVSVNGTIGDEEDSDVQSLHTNTNGYNLNRSYKQPGQEDIEMG